MSRCVFTWEKMLTSEEKHVRDWRCILASGGVCVCVCMHMSCGCVVVRVCLQQGVCVTVCVCVYILTVDGGGTFKGGTRLSASSQVFVHLSGAPLLSRSLQSKQHGLIELWAGTLWRNFNNTEARTAARWTPRSVWFVSFISSCGIHSVWALTAAEQVSGAVIQVVSVTSRYLLW